MFLNKMVSPYKALKISQVPNSLFFIIYINRQITGEGGRNGSSHTFFQLLARHLKKIKSPSTFFPKDAKKSSKHEFLNGGGVSQLY